MSTLTFDKLIYYQRLKDSGIPEAQDEALREAIATKYDLEILKRDLTIRMGGIAIALAAFLTAVKFFG